MSSSGEVKFEFNLPNTSKTIYSRITSSGKGLLSYDNGLFELTPGTNLNFFGSIQSSRTFKDAVYKVGLACVGENYSYAFRCRYHQEAKDKSDFHFHVKGSNKGSWKHGGWRFNFNSIYSPTLNKLIRSGVLLGIRNRHSKDYFNLKVESGSKRMEGLELKDICSYVTFRWLKTVNSQLKVGCEVFHSIDRPPSTVKIGNTFGKTLTLELSGGSPASQPTSRLV